MDSLLSFAMLMQRGSLGGRKAVANEEHLAKLREGVEAWNTWREASPGVRPDLSEAKLSAPNLGQEGR